jgi:hypothetical protein
MLFTLQIMKLIILVTLIFGISIDGFCQSSTIDRIAMDQMIINKYRGHIKKCDKIEYTCYDSLCNNSRKYWTTSYFDKNGHKTKDVIHYEKGDYITTFEYKGDLIIKEKSDDFIEENVLNEKGNVIYYLNISGKDTTKIISYQYDNNGKLISSTFYTENKASRITNFTYLLDDCEEVCQEILLYNNFQGYDKKIYLNDRDGKTIKNTCIKQNDTISVTTFERQNDMVVSTTVSYADGSKNIKYFKEDSFGNTVCISNSLNGDCEEKVIYTYDRHGNILTELYYKLGQLKYKYQNTYEYWD